MVQLSDAERCLPTVTHVAETLEYLYPHIFLTVIETLEAQWETG